jgi:hypothetical protein
VSDKITERDMLDGLGRRFTQRSQGIGDRWVRAEHVRNGTGFFGYNEQDYLKYGRSVGQLRTADYMAFDTWESKGHIIHGVEVKVSRGDWLTELRDPEKAAAFSIYWDYWWLAVPDAAIVRDDLPKGWGLLVLQPNGIVTRRQAPRNADKLPLPVPIQFGIMRAVQKTAERAALRGLEVAA